MGFGGMGLFAVSVIDSSIIPLPVPGSSDLLLILLVAHRANPVLMAIAAILGSILGGYLTWGTGSKGGEAALLEGFAQDNRFGAAPTALGRSWDRRPSPAGLG
jgi:membrane protein YqaA with SNARE-associated domain